MEQSSSLHSRKAIIKETIIVKQSRSVAPLWHFANSLQYVLCIVGDANGQLHRFIMSVVFVGKVGVEGIIAHDLKNYGKFLSAYFSPVWPPMSTCIVGQDLVRVVA